MAELIGTSPSGGSPVATAGAGSATPGSVDARAVRVRLAPSSRIEGEEEAVIRIGPGTEPLRMTNPTVGRGLLGGAAPGVLPTAAAPDADGGSGVLAQRRAIEVDGTVTDAVLLPGAGGRRQLVVDGVGARLVLEAAAAMPGGARRREVLVNGFRFEVETESERIAVLRERATRGRATTGRTGPLEVKAIIPGKVVAVSVSAGDAVAAGQQLLVVEAMKMQNELRAPRDGTISRVGVAPGVNIEVGDLLVVIS